MNEYTLFADKLEHIYSYFNIIVLRTWIQELLAQGSHQIAFIALARGVMKYELDDATFSGSHYVKHQATSEVSQLLL